MMVKWGKVKIIETFEFNQLRNTVTNLHGKL